MLTIVSGIGAFLILLAIGLVSQVS